MKEREGAVLPFPGAERGEADAAHARAVRMAEAILFASAEPVSTAALAERLGEADAERVLADLAQHYAARGVNLVQRDDHWAFRTADDLAFLLRRDTQEVRRMGKAALEVLAIIAYHQPATRAEIEAIRGVATSKGTLDTLLEMGFVQMRGRRQAAGRPVTYGTTLAFLDHFGLETLRDLPGLEDLRGAGLLQAEMPVHFAVPQPGDRADDGLAEDEDPLEAADLEELGILSPGGAGSDGTESGGTGEAD